MKKLTVKAKASILKKLIKKAIEFRKEIDVRVENRLKFKKYL